MALTSSDMEAETNSKDRRNHRNSMDVNQVPDGGLHAWLVVVASFLTNGIIFGIHNCYGIIYVRLKSELEQSGVSDAATKACKSSPILRLDLTIPLFLTVYLSILFLQL